MDELNFERMGTQCMHSILLYQHEHIINYTSIRSVSMQNKLIDRNEFPKKNNI